MNNIHVCTCTYRFIIQVYKTQVYKLKQYDALR